MAPLAVLESSAAGLTGGVGLRVETALERRWSASAMTAATATMMMAGGPAVDGRRPAMARRPTAADGRGRPPPGAEASSEATWRRACWASPCVRAACADGAAAIPRAGAVAVVVDAEGAGRRQRSGAAMAGSGWAGSGRRLACRRRADGATTRVRRRCGCWRRRQCCPGRRGARGCDRAWAAE